VDEGFGITPARRRRLEVAKLSKDETRMSNHTVHDAEDGSCSKCRLEAENAQLRAEVERLKSSEHLRNRYREAIRNQPCCHSCREVNRCGATADASTEAIENAVKCDECLDLIVALLVRI
jgi:hypothetical protein